MMGFAADADPSAAVTGYLLLGIFSVGGVLCVVIGALAMQKKRLAAQVGIALSLAVAGGGALANNLGTIPTIGVAAVLALPAIYLALGLLGPLPRLPGRATVGSNKE